MDDNGQLPGGDDPQPPAAPAATGTATTLTSEQVRNSPEYVAMQRQLRAEARQRGDAERQLAEARAQAETARLAAEAQAQASVQEQVEQILGADGVAAWTEIAELSGSDPVAAARKFNELMGKMQATQQQTPEAVVTQPTQPQAQPVPRTLDAATPLGTVAAPDPYEQEITDLEGRWSTAVEKNRKTPNRMTENDRANGITAYMKAAYLKARRGLAGG